MPLETADYIDELNPLWPLGTDDLNTSDDHHRVTKKAVQQSFPNIDQEVTATATDLNTITDAANTGVLVPTGAILPYAAAVAPNGYLFCDGAAIDPQYTDLITLIGANTPDLRGTFLRGWSADNSVDPDGPRAPLTTQTDAFEAHTHTYAINTDDTGSNRADNAGDTGGNFNLPTSSAGTATETRPVNTTVSFIIKT